MGGIQRLKGLNVANHLEKRSLLIAINSIAALSIFFFGYDQGMMGGVNVSVSQPGYNVTEWFALGITLELEGPHTIGSILKLLRPPRTM